ncbi:cupin domain-containing protein [Bombilactobacillus thymidiniphilus]|uniref:Cupin domain-containing protein n=1 Tax=Bombilactobacillus thymidiniphilus TaxID=2923363 RepID=A0ABY4PEP5_9LACO|nr:cupin domain-containing protein [Bombilactobacillus thymidiniphilus]UQS84164.1 cupin domain-containing protein [Bombilactobacillus thymidiniphilus]
MNTKEQYIEQLGLTPHAEGGWFKEVSHSTDRYFAPESNGERYRYTSILFLLDTTSPSHLHQLNHDELWFYHVGQAITIHCISPEGQYWQVKLGTDLANGELLQYTVPQQTIFGAEIQSETGFSVVSCVVAPGFDYHDFILSDRQQLLQKYPQLQEVINKMAVDKLVDRV